MAMKMKVTHYDGPAKQILAIPDHYVALGAKHLKATAEDPGLAVLQEGRYIVKAGTVYPANDATAIGIVFTDYDVTDGDQMMAIVRHGFVKSAALPEAVTPEAKEVLKLIEFVDPVA